LQTINRVLVAWLKVSMAFSIGLIHDTVTNLDPGVVASLGIIQIGSYQERFIASLMYWSADDYRCHWKQAIERILNSSDVSCLITSMVDPTARNHIFWWPMYRENNTVFIQNCILFFDQLQSPFDERNPFSSVTERQTIDEDDNRISEWSVQINELEEFLIKEYTTL
jgi:contact-dependent growth inhibition (CDI) system CdiI-like immunity protein